MEDIEKVIIYMLQNNGIFYASVIEQMRRVADNNFEHPIAVSIRNGRIELKWNPEKFSDFKDIKEKAAVCEHECEHIVKNHIGRAKDKKLKLWYIACDLAINQTIPNIPANGLKISDFPGIKLQPKKAADYYYEKLKQNEDQIHFKKDENGKDKVEISPSNSGSNDGSTNGSSTLERNKAKEFDLTQPDDHSDWEQSSDKAEEVQEIIREAVNNAVIQTRRMRGKVPSHLEKYIEDLFKNPVIPWWLEIKNWIGNNVRSGRKYTYKRPNRRFGTSFKGRLSDHLVKVVIAVDTSGSMSEQDLKEAFTEVRGILESYKNDITLIQCDADIQSVEKISRYGNPKFKVKGRGGTDFNPIFKYIKDNNLNPDMLIFFSDLEGVFPNDTPPYSVLWVSVTDPYETPPFGRLISIPENKKQMSLDQS